MGPFASHAADPQAAPRALNLVLSAGVKADGHAQYLIFTSTITFTPGGKLLSLREQRDSPFVYV